MSSAPQNTALLTLWPLLVACAIAVPGNGRSAVPETCLPRQLVAAAHCPTHVLLTCRIAGVVHSNTYASLDILGQLSLTGLALA